MKKLKLDLDDLKVESFETTPADSRRGGGTLFGYTAAPSDCNTCELAGGLTNQTCGNTCAHTCFGITCGNTCAGNTCDDNTCAGNTCHIIC